MPIPDDFSAECLYAPDHWFVHDVRKIDLETHEVIGVIDTTRLGSLVEAQQPRPGHVPHLPGAIAIHVTGTLGNLHAVYAMGLRPSQGWIGYGTHLKGARFRRLATIGPPVIASAVCHRRRQIRGTWFLEYRFSYVQDDEIVFESEQTAAWNLRTG